MFNPFRDKETNTNCCKPGVSACRRSEAQIAPAAPIIECGCAGMFNVLPPHTSQLDCLFFIIYCWSNFMDWLKHIKQTCATTLNNGLECYWMFLLIRWSPEAAACFVQCLILVTYYIQHHAHTNITTSIPEFLLPSQGIRESRRNGVQIRITTSVEMGRARSKTATLSDKVSVI